MTQVHVGGRREAWGNPSEVFAKSASTFTANICADCGFTEFYAKKPTAVWEGWSKQKH